MPQKPEVFEVLRCGTLKDFLILDIEKLAEEGARKLPEGKNFFVKSTMIPCNGDCSWDCK